MQSSQLTGDRGKPRKTLRETIKELHVDKLDRDMIYDGTLWWCLIHIPYSRPT